MTDKEKIAAIQLILEVSPDGIAGPKTQAAWDNLVESSKAQPQKNTEQGTSGAIQGEILTGDGTWPWTARIEGDDIVVENAKATCFGGTDDPQDSGETASGISTKNPNTEGVALPRNYIGTSSALIKALGGSPIPNGIPFKTPVEITSGDRTVTAPFIDIGPAKYTGNALDLTIATAKHFNPSASAINFSIKCSYRIVGAAKYA